MAQSSRKQKINIALKTREKPTIAPNSEKNPSEQQTDFLLLAKEILKL